MKIHEETGISEDMLTGDVLYYGDTSSQVVDIHNQADLDQLLDNSGDKLIVLDMGLKYCGPCVKVSQGKVAISSTRFTLCWAS